MSMAEIIDTVIDHNLNPFGLDQIQRMGAMLLLLHEKEIPT